MTSIKNKSYFCSFGTFVFFIISSCSSGNETGQVSTLPTSTQIPTVYAKIYGATSMSSDGTFITIKTNDLPDHKSIYYPANNALYENFSGTTFGGNTFKKNPNLIISQNLTFKIPVNPKEATNHAARLLAQSVFH
ncbi:hypothetical protein [Halpernia frigidisoli]|uniref:hypothetical protein n=1 Tax=Halpernia frigidisoli TaxID=1125876 RepID=UPI001F21138B|nr:hypothetical protein [Halpernia frigidisoli]